MPVAVEKGTVKETGINGVKVGKNLDDIIDITQKILGGTLVTIQTGPAGKVVNKVLVAQDIYYDGPWRTQRILSLHIIRSQQGAECSYV
jgi:succinyl-CoA synthetase beta subunit